MKSQNENTDFEPAYDLQSITIRMLLEVLPGISVLEIRHYDERLVI
jgi:hypothetical protein